MSKLLSRRYRYTVYKLRVDNPVYDRARVYRQRSLFPPARFSYRTHEQKKMDWIMKGTPFGDDYGGMKL